PSPLLPTPFFFHPPPPSPIYTLSLHDALPIYRILGGSNSCTAPINWPNYTQDDRRIVPLIITPFGSFSGSGNDIVPVVENEPNRSEEHTSELQSRGHLVCRLLLEKKKMNKKSQ